MFCSNCGKELPETARFCSKCGIKIENIQVSMPDGENTDTEEAMSSFQSPSDDFSSCHKNIENISCSTNEDSTSITNFKDGFKIKKYWPRSFFIISVIAVIIVVAAFLIITAFNKSAKASAYSKAQSLFEAGDYASAASAFKDLMDYQDSEDKYKESIYLTACINFEAGNYVSAASAFKDLMSYQDSEDKYKESTYCAAYINIEEEQYESAKELLLNLGEYYNTSDLINYCDFQSSFSKAGTYCSEERYGDAYDILQNLPICSETSNLLQKMIAENSVNLVTLEDDFNSNSVRAEQEYANKFFFISGTVQGTDTSFFENEAYLKIKVGNCSDYAHCYDLSPSEIASFDKGDNALLAGYFDANYGWIGIDFKSCSVIDTDYLSSNQSIKQILDISNVFSNFVYPETTNSNASSNGLDSSQNSEPSNIPVTYQDIEYGDFVGIFNGEDAENDALIIEWIDFTLCISCYGYRMDWYYAEIPAETELVGNSITFDAQDRYSDSVYKVTLIYIPAADSPYGVDTIYMQSKDLFDMTYTRSPESDYFNPYAPSDPT